MAVDGTQMIASNCYSTIRNVAMTDRAAAPKRFNPDNVKADELEILSDLNGDGVLDDPADDDDDDNDNDEVITYKYENRQLKR